MSTSAQKALLRCLGHLTLSLVVGIVLLAGMLFVAAIAGKHHLPSPWDWVGLIAMLCYAPAIIGACLLARLKRPVLSPVTIAVVYWLMPASFLALDIDSVAGGPGVLTFIVIGIIGPPLAALGVVRVVRPLRELDEDEEDLRACDERKDEESIPFESSVEEQEANGKL